MPATIRPQSSLLILLALLGTVASAAEPMVETWRAEYASERGGEDEAGAAVVDSQGRTTIVATAVPFGLMEGLVFGLLADPGPRELFVLQVDAGGRERWRRKPPLGGFEDLGIHDTRMGPGDSIEILLTTESSPNCRTLLLRLDAEGEELGAPELVQEGPCDGAWARFARFLAGPGGENRLSLDVRPFDVRQEAEIFGRKNGAWELLFTLPTTWLIPGPEGELWAASNDGSRLARYSALGEQLLVLDLAGRVTGLIVDDTGNAIFREVAFESTLLRKISPDGRLIWERQFENPYGAMAAGADGRTFVVGSERVASVSGDGEMLWETVAPRDVSWLNAWLVPAPDGVVYVLSHPVTATRVSATGEVLWSATSSVAGPPQCGGFLGGSLVGADGELQIAGTSYPLPFLKGCTEGDLFVARFGPDGDEPWSARIDTPGRGDLAAAIETDAGGNVFVAARHAGSGPAILKYDESGRELWRREFLPGLEDYGDVFLAVTDDGTAALGHGTSLRAMSPDGDLLWKTVEPLDRSDSLGALGVAGLATGPDERIYVVRARYFNVGDRSSELSAYSRTGEELWYLGLPDGPTKPHVDRDGNVVVSGHVVDPRGSTGEVRTLKISPDGEVLWSVSEVVPHITGTAGIALGPDGSLAVAFAHSGPFIDDSRDDVVQVFNYYAHGELRWTGSWSAPSYAQARLGVSMSGLTSLLLFHRPNFAELIVVDGDGTTIGSHQLPQTLSAALAVSRDGSVYVLANDGDRDLQLLGFSASGDLERREALEGDPDGLPGSAAWAGAVAIDDVGDVLVTGTLDYRVVTLRYTRAPSRFLRGDSNADGGVDISDAISIIGFLFLGEPATLACRESADSNNDGTIDISDGIYLLSWLFTGGPEPVAPGPADRPCGVDPDEIGSPGDLGCMEYPPCW